MRNRLLGSGLSGRSGHTDDLFYPNAAYSGGQCLQRLKRVIDSQQTGFHRKARQLILAHDRGDGSTLERLVHEVVAIQAFALDCKEKFAGLDSTGVDRVSVRDFFQLTFASCVEKLLDLRERQLHPFCPALAVAAWHS